MTEFNASETLETIKNSDYLKGLVAETIRL